MAAIAFDTLKCARRLKDVGYTDQQAEVQAEIMAEAFVYNMDALVTKDYLDARIDGKFSEQDARIDSKFAHIDVQFAEIKGQFRLVYWMLAVVIASTVIPQVNTLLSN
jgi:alpha-ketoglutarate-dependent taurine dioxygenase